MLTFAAASPASRTSTRERKPISGEAPAPAQRRRRSASKPKERTRASAESLSKQQRDISVSEFFAKNRHLLGFDNKRKALLTTVKEAMDNSLDACEEGGILPDVEVTVTETGQDRYRVTVLDNGPGIVKQQIPNVFGKLLYGSKFHRLKMSRGQQGIGISAAGMYGLITTGKPTRIVSRTGSRSQAHCYTLAIDTKKNRPDIIADEPASVDWPHGTEVSIEIAATYSRGRQSIEEYLNLTAIANPHARIVYHPPGNARTIEYPRGTEQLPEETKEIKPHPYGIELGTFLKMLKETQATKLGGFLATEFTRVNPSVAKQVCAKAGVTTATWLSTVSPEVAERVYQALQASKLKAPSTNCLAPMGAEAILSGLLKGIRAEFYTASTRPPSVYCGNPFQVEVGLAYGGELGSDRHDGEADGHGDKDPGHVRVIRFANRVPLLYQQSSCCMFKAVAETRWNNYGLSQSAGALPKAPMVLLIHLASVWVPFISESKEAIADYDEIRKEVKLAIAECGRRLATLLKRKRKKADHVRRRDVFTRYIDEVVEAAGAMARIDRQEFRRSLLDLSTVYTERADMEFDEHGKVVKRKHAGNDFGLEDTIIVERDEANRDRAAGEYLLDLSGDGSGKKKTRKRKKASKQRRR